MEMHPRREALGGLGGTNSKLCGRCRQPSFTAPVQRDGKFPEGSRAPTGAGQQTEGGGRDAFGCKLQVSSANRVCRWQIAGVIMGL